MTYFRELPSILYQSPLSTRSSSDEYVEVKNLFRRVKLRDDLKDSITYLTNYYVRDGFRPDQVAADLYGSSGTIAQASSAKLKHGVFGYINAVSYTFNEEGTWNNFEEGGRAPKYITATIGYQVIHDETPNINTRFYGLNHAKIGV